MPKIVPIVEGEGEVKAVPKLLYKLLYEAGRYDIQIGHVKNAHTCSNLKKRGGLESFINLASREADCAGILVLMDADEDCPMTIAQEFARRIGDLGTKFPCAVVIANSEYEAWILASLTSIVGKNLKDDNGLERPGIPETTEPPDDPEGKRDAKGWISQRLPGLNNKYQETTDQAIMTQWIDPALARERSRSFRRLCHALEELLEAMDNQTVRVTPMLPDIGKKRT